MAYINEGTIAFLKSIQSSLNPTYVTKKKQNDQVIRKIKTFKIKKIRK